MSTHRNTPSCWLVQVLWTAITRVNTAEPGATQANWERAWYLWVVLQYYY